MKSAVFLVLALSLQILSSYAQSSSSSGSKPSNSTTSSSSSSKAASSSSQTSTLGLNSDCSSTAIMGSGNDPCANVNPQWCCLYISTSATKTCQYNPAKLSTSVAVSSTSTSVSSTSSVTAYCANSVLIKITIFITAIGLSAVFY